MLDSDAAQPVALPIQETSVMVGVTPINAKKIFIAPPECGGVEALSADAVTVFLLEPSGGRPLWTVTPVNLGRQSDVSAQGAAAGRSSVPRWTTDRTSEQDDGLIVLTAF